MSSLGAPSLGHRTFWVSPAPLAIASSLSGIAFTFIPPSFYSRVMREPDYMYADMRAIAFILLCTLGFAIGTFCIRQNVRQPDHRWLNSHPTALRVLAAAILVAAAAGSAWYLLRIINAFPNLAASLLLGTGWQLRQQFAQLGLENTPLVLSGFLIIWAGYVAMHAKPIRHIRLGSPLTYVFYTALIVFCASCIVSQQRNVLLPVILALLIVYFQAELAKGGHNLRRLAVVGTITVTSVVAIFLGIALIRSAADTSEAWGTLFGYIPASYNRLSAILGGNLKFGDTGMGLYSFKLFYYPPVIGNLLNIPRHLNEMGLDLPQSWVDNFDTQFYSVAVSRLNYLYIWLTTFGFVYEDFGWWSPLYFLGLGLVLQLVFVWYERGARLAATMYPMLATTIMMWFGDNFAVATAMAAGFIVTIGLTVAAFALNLACDTLTPSAATETREDESPVAMDCVPSLTI